MGRADQVDQLLDAVIGVAETELGRRNAEFRGLGGDAHVAGERGADTAADAVAADHRDGGFEGLLQAQPRALGNLRIGGSRFLGGAPLLEFGNVGAGDKGAPAGAADDDDPDRVVALEIVNDAGHRLPHFERDGIVPRRVVEDQAADTLRLLGDHFAGDRLVEHGSLLRRLRGRADRQSRCRSSRVRATAHRCAGRARASGAVWPAPACGSC